MPLEGALRTCSKQAAHRLDVLPTPLKRPKCAWSPIGMLCHNAEVLIFDSLPISLGSLRNARACIKRHRTPCLNQSLIFPRSCSSSIFGFSQIFLAIAHTLPLRSPPIRPHNNDHPRRPPFHCTRMVRKGLDQCQPRSCPTSSRTRLLHCSNHRYSER